MRFLALTVMAMNMNGMECRIMWFGKQVLIFGVEDGGNRFVQKVGSCRLNCKLSHFSGQQYWGNVLFITGADSLTQNMIGMNVSVRIAATCRRQEHKTTSS
jgi:hypothetical protein